MTIEKVSSNLSVDESAALANNISKGLETDTTEDQFVVEKKATIETLSNDLTESIRQSRAQEHTKLLYSLDKKRDKLLSAFKAFLKAYLNWDEGKNIEMAKRLRAVIKEHGTNIERLGYNAQSARMNSLIAEFAKPKSAEAITELNLVELVEAIKLAQTTFADTFGDARDTVAQKEDIESATVLKKLLKSEIDLLSNYVSVMLISQGDSYKPIYNNIVVHINEANNSVN